MATVSDGDWRKSSFCSANSCVEVKVVNHGAADEVLLRHSFGLTTFRFTTREWDAFLAGVKAGEFDRDARTPQTGREDTALHGRRETAKDGSRSVEHEPSALRQF